MTTRALFGAALAFALCTCGAEGPPRVVIPDPTGGEIVGVRAGDTFAYLLRRGERVVLVDAGSDTEARAIIAELGRMELGPDAVEAVLLTHGHLDQRAGAAMFERATVFVGAGDHLLVRGDALPRGLRPKLTTRLSPKPPRPRRIRHALPGMVLRVGGRRLEVIATPGHTRGASMYLHHHLLFSGDSLLCEGEEIALPPWLDSNSVDQARRAAKRLKGLPITAVADGRNGWAGGIEGRLARFLGHLD